MRVSAEGHSNHTIPLASNQMKSFKSFEKVEVPHHIVQQDDISFGSEVDALEFDLNVGIQVEFSPSGRFLALAGEGTIIWDVIAGNEKWRSQSYASVLAFSPDEKILGTVSATRLLTLWNATDGTKIAEKKMGKFDQIFDDITFSPDGTEIISTGNNESIGKLFFWDVATLELLNEIENPYGGSEIVTPGPSEYVPVALSPNGSILATGSSSENGYVLLWNLTSKTLLNYFPGHTGFVRTLAFSPDSTLLVSGSDDTTLRIWNLTSKTEVSSSPLQEHTEGIISTCFSPDGAILASSCGDQSPGTIILWDVASWTVIPPPIHHLEKPRLAFSPAGTILVSTSYFVRGTDWLSEMKFWSMVRGQTAVQSWQTPTTVNSLEFGSTGDLLASADANALISLWNISDPQIVSNFTEATSTIVGTSIALSPDDQWLVSGSEDNVIRFWNVTSGLIQYTLTGHDSSVLTVAFSPDGHWLASGDGEGTIKLWNVTDKANMVNYDNLTGHLSGVTALTFSPDSQLLASGSFFASILLWNITDWTRTDAIMGHTDRITSLMFSTDSQWLASGSWDTTLRYRHINNSSGTNTLVIQHFSEVNSVTLSPNGLILVAGCQDGSIRISNATDGTLLSSLTNHGREILAVTITPDGKTLASAGGDNEIRLWIIDPLPLDLDLDGMKDSWEKQYGLDPDDFLDVFSDPDDDGLMNSMESWLNTNPQDSDTDNDDLPDLWEVLYDSNPRKEDSDGDVDSDGIANWYEFQMGLNSFVDDTLGDEDGDSLTNLQEYKFNSSSILNDTDQDGMPDWWEHEMSFGEFGDLNPRLNDSLDDLDDDKMLNLIEFRYNFSATNPMDAQYDADFDWVTNLDEILAGTDPRNFWSFPLLSMSIIHIAAGLILLIIGSSGVIFTFYRKSQRSRLITRFEAPDYETAVKIHQADLADYPSYQLAISEAKTILKEAITAFHQGDYSKATDKCRQALDSLEQLNSNQGITEAIFHLLQMLKEQGTLTQTDSLFQRVSPPPFKDPTTAAYSNMIKAIQSEIEANWGAAESSWRKALKFEYLDMDSRMICLGALAESAFRMWFYDQTDQTQARLLARLEEWQRTCEASERSGSLCPVILMRARLSLASYRFDKMEQHLAHCERIASEAGLKRFQILAQKASEQLLEHKDRIEALFKAEMFLLPEDRGKLLQQYIRKAVLLLGEDD